MAIRTRMILSVVAVFVLGAAIIGIASWQSYEAALDDAAQSSVDRAATILTQAQQDDTAKLSATLTGLMADNTYRSLFVSGDREGLLNATSGLFERLREEFQITHWYFETAGDDPTIFLRVHKPEQFDDAITRKTYKAAVDENGYGAGLELGKTAIALRVVHPYYAEDGSLIGYMEVGQEIDHFLDHIKEQSGDEASLLLLKDSLGREEWAAYREQKGLADNWDDNASYVLAGATADSAGQAAAEYDGPVASLADAGDVLGSYAEGGRTVVRGIVPMRDVEGNAIGAVIVEHDITDAAAGLLQQRLITMGVILGMFTVVLLALGYLMNRLVFQRLERMMTGMEDISMRLAGGDFQVHYEASGSTDEIGRFEQFFSQFIDTVGATLRQLTRKSA